MKPSKIYYCTACIRYGQRVFVSDKCKDVIIRYLQLLHDKKCARIYGYVIMPDHIHVLMEVLRRNDSEQPFDRLLRESANRLQVLLYDEQPMMLYHISPEMSGDVGSIWQLPAITRQVQNSGEVMQLLHNMHQNPLRHHWRLCRTAADYGYSSSLFYERGRDEFDMLSNYRDWVRV
ncbi:transposase [Chitinophaga horti]|uniref:Transposase n=1 Tax=Chitinophaga horti TaxID=2920382 RepID=A0ABY6J754_9BACT|nr:transposase [Chitinophaga horti]UYQ95191.1 transposase [Chitinophaga horti]